MCEGPTPSAEDAFAQAKIAFFEDGPLWTPLFRVQGLKLGYPRVNSDYEGNDGANNRILWRCSSVCEQFPDLDEWLLIQTLREYLSNRLPALLKLQGEGLGLWITCAPKTGNMQVQNCKQESKRPFFDTFWGPVYLRIHV